MIEFSEKTNAAPIAVTRKRSNLQSMRFFGQHELQLMACANLEYRQLSLHSAAPTCIPS
jgi:hypothetical protein